MPRARARGRRPRVRKPPRVGAAARAVRRRPRPHRPGRARRAHRRRPRRRRPGRAPARRPAARPRRGRAVARASTRPVAARSADWWRPPPAGPIRMSSGPVRDLSSASTMVRADGVVAKSGGKVVKNVAGYDLGKLSPARTARSACITEVALRLHPLPEKSTLGMRARRLPDRGPGRRAEGGALAPGPLGVELDWRDGRGESPCCSTASRAGWTLAPGTPRSSSARARGRRTSGPAGGDRAETGTVLLRISHEVASLGRGARRRGQPGDQRRARACGTLYVAVDADEAVTGRRRSAQAASRFGGAVVVLDAPADDQA